MLSSRKAADLESSAAELKAAGIDVQWIAADCADEKDIHRLAAETLKAFGHVDILVNNAGAAWGAPAEDHPIEAWDKVMNLNVNAMFFLSQYVGKHVMIPKKSGKIINISSVAGLAGNPPGMATIAYNTSKGADINFTRALAAAALNVIGEEGTEKGGKGDEAKSGTPMASAFSFPALISFLSACPIVMGTDILIPTTSRIFDFHVHFHSHYLPPPFSSSCSLSVSPPFAFSFSQPFLYFILHPPPSSSPTQPPPAPWR
jgi:hypothetical protein